MAGSVATKAAPKLAGPWEEIITFSTLQRTLSRRLTPERTNPRAQHAPSVSWHCRLEGSTAEASERSKNTAASLELHADASSGTTAASLLQHASWRP